MDYVGITQGHFCSNACTNKCSNTTTNNKSLQTFRIRITRPNAGLWHWSENCVARMTLYKGRHVWLLTGILSGQFYFENIVCHSLLDLITIFTRAVFSSTQTNFYLPFDSEKKTSQMGFDCMCTLRSWKVLYLFYLNLFWKNDCPQMVYFQGLFTPWWVINLRRGGGGRGSKGKNRGTAISSCRACRLRWWQGKATVACR